MAPLCPLGPIALPASLLLDSWVPNALLQLQGVDIHSYEAAELPDYLAASFHFTDWYVQKPAGAGSGNRLKEAKIMEAASTGHA
ncbi:MAG TPA: hypothetical protein VGS41_09710 [Chthonomonadales bacterium]|nr:hypothetical protein [Chthonomonadales bacterium]